MRKAREYRAEIGVRAFGDRLDQLVTSLFARIRPGHRINEHAITRAEERLKNGLPLILRQYYRAVGWHPKVIRAQNRLLPPSKLYIRGDGLVLEEENQLVCFSAIPLKDLDADDPPVSKDIRTWTDGMWKVRGSPTTCWSRSACRRAASCDTEPECL